MESRLCPYISVRIKAVIRLGNTMRCFLNISYKAGVHTFVRLHRRRQALDRDEREVFLLFKMYEVITRTICS